MRFLLTAAAVLMLAACGDDQAARKDGAAHAAVQVSDVWCRPTPNGARTGACYATLTAQGRDDRLVGVSTPAAGMAMAHRMEMKDGIMRMADGASELALPDGRPITLAPGGTHLMLMGLKGPLTAGSTVPLTLDFAEAPDVTVQAAVRQPAA